MPIRSKSPEKLQELARRLRQWAKESESASYTRKLNEAAELVEGAAGRANEPSELDTDEAV